MFFTDINNFGNTKWGNVIFKLTNISEKYSMMKFEPASKCVAFIYRKGSRIELEKETAILLGLADRVTEVNGELGWGGAK